MLNRPTLNQVWVKKKEHISLGYELSDLLKFGDIEVQTKYKEPAFFDISGLQAFQVAAGLISVYLCKVYLQTLLQEAAKDHYKYVKQKLSDIFKKKVSEQRNGDLLITTFEILLGDNLYVRFTLPHEYSDIDKAIESMFSMMRGMIAKDDILKQELVSMSKKKPLIEYHSDERWVVNYIYQNDTGIWAIKYNSTKESSNNAS